MRRQTPMNRQARTDGRAEGSVLLHDQRNDVFDFRLLEKLGDI